MYVSMTGFSRSQMQTSWGTLSMELSSVNHRYQEISVRLPREFV
ncbi:MAG: YicC family protein, partial [Cloacibacillus sp.]|nr:YicC family protein [Cloacibacillus sp.]